MGRDPNQNETLDLFSGAADPSLKGASQAVARRSSRRPALPKDLPKAIRYLADEELDWLLRVAIQETKRRGRPMRTTVAPPTSTPAGSSMPIAEPSRKPMHKQAIGVTAVALTRGQVNAVRAAFKAGVTPSRIARQFGLSQTQVRRALSSDEPR